jgi:hypothetical protein
MSHAKTFAAIDKLKEIESELHRLKNALELANRALEAEREACALIAQNRFLCDGSDDARKGHYEACKNIAAAIRARGQE